MKVGILVEGFEHVDPAVQRHVREAAYDLVNAGVTVEDVSVPFHTDGKVKISVTTQVSSLII